MTKYVQDELGEVFGTANDQVRMMMIMMTTSLKKNVKKNLEVFSARWRSYKKKDCLYLELCTKMTKLMIKESSSSLYC